MVKISIIVPVYNVEEYLEKCLESIINQSLKEIEIILVNDGSQDKSQEIIDNYKNKDERIKCIYQNNAGVSIARNAGLDIATGEYISFVDSDDTIDENMCSILYEKIVAEKSDIINCNYVKEYVDGKLSSPVIQFKELELNLEEFGFTNFVKYRFLTYAYGCEVWGRLFKREIIEDYNIRFDRIDEIYAEDLLFNLYYLLHTKKITIVDIPLYYYYQRSGSLMRSDNPYLTDKHLELVRRFEGKCKEYGNTVKVENCVSEMTYAVVNSSVNKNKEFSKMYSALKSAYNDSDFQIRMKNMFLNKESAIYERIFCWLAYKKYIKLAVLYCIFKEKMIIVYHFVKGL